MAPATRIPNIYNLRTCFSFHFYNIDPNIWRKRMKIVKAEKVDADVIGWIHFEAWQQAYINIFPTWYLKNDTSNKRKQEFFRIVYKSSGNLKSLNHSLRKSFCKIICSVLKVHQLKYSQ